MPAFELLRCVAAEKPEFFRPSAFAAIFLAATVCSAGEKRPENVGTTGGSRLVSPAVVATWIVRTEPRDVAELKLLVLWRGAPGWFLRTDSSGLSGRVLTQSGGGENDGV